MGMLPMESRDTSVMSVSGIAGKIPHLGAIRRNVKKRYCEHIKSGVV
jgi:hypothetical protein